MKKSFFAMILFPVLLWALLSTAVHASTEISSISLSGFREPVAGAKCENFLVLTAETEGVSFHGVDWFDKTGNCFLESNESFQSGRVYQVQIWIKAQSGYSFRCVNDNTPSVTATLDGKALSVTKAFEYKAFAMVVLNYEFAPVGSGAPAHTHTPSAWRVTGAYHYKACTTCGDFLNQEDHKWSPCFHAVDASGHYAFQCSECNTYGTLRPHDPGPAATQTDPQSCKDCGYILAPAVKHTHQLTRFAEIAPTCMEAGTGAYYACNGCSLRFRDAAATNQIAANETLTLPPLGHRVSDDFHFNESTHWRICSVCKEKLLETDMAHELQDGKCTTCQYGSTAPTESDPTKPTSQSTTPTKTTAKATQKVTQPQSTEKNEGGLPWWALLLIGLAATFVGIGGGILVMHLTKKKKE